MDRFPSPSPGWPMRQPRFAAPAEQSLLPAIFASLTRTVPSHHLLLPPIPVDALARNGGVDFFRIRVLRSAS